MRALAVFALLSVSSLAQTPVVSKSFVIADVHRRAEAEAQFPRGGKAEPEDRP